VLNKKSCYSPPDQLASVKLALISSLKKIMQASFRREKGKKKGERR
jgi:hypothetical protein